MSEVTVVDAIDFLTKCAGIALIEGMIHKKRDTFVEFALPMSVDADKLAKKISKSLGVKMDSYRDHHGDQRTWDLPEKRRVTLCQRFDEEPIIGMMVLTPS